MQLPGGSLYAPAMLEAAAKTGARSGLATKTTKSLSAMVTASLAVLNSGSSSMIALEMRVHDDSISAKITGKGCASPTKKSVRELETVAAKRSRSFDSKITKTAHTISFEV